MDILTIENLNKRFGNIEALRTVSFNVEEGSVTGLLGPNGAGKTTLLRIINAILSADSGEVRIDGKRVSLQTSNLVGYMPEERGLYDKMSVHDQILYFGLLKGGDKMRLREVMREYLDLFQLKGQEHRKIKELSKGNQQKVQIISTLVHEPRLVMLDEPFSGFDPINGQILQAVIERLKNNGTTIMLSSHNMSAIEEMCDDMALINHGTLLIKDKIENIKELHKDNSLIVTVNKPLSAEFLLKSGKISKIEDFTEKSKRKGYAYKLWKSEGVRNMDIVDLIAMQSDIRHFEEALPSLTDIFIKYTSTQK